MRSCDMMVDLETLGMPPDGIIVSIACVPFDPEDGIIDEGKRWNITIDSNIAEGRKFTPQTVEWWLKQSKEAQESLFDIEPQPLVNVLQEFCEYVQKHLGKKRSVWVNGASFDFILLKDALIKANIKIPWHFRQESCMRALLRIGRSFEIEYKKYSDENKGIAHNALDDCIIQARYIIDFIKIMRKVD